MTKGYIDTDEWYPVYTIDIEPTYQEDAPIEIPDDLVNRYHQAMVKFDEVQKELRMLLNHEH